MRLHGWPVSFSHSAAIAQITVSSIKLWLVRVIALWDETFLQSFNIFYVSKEYLYSIINIFSCFCAFWSYFVFLLLVFSNFLKIINRCLYGKWIIIFKIPMFVVVLSVLINSEHHESTVLSYCFHLRDSDYKKSSVVCCTDWRQT
jgi:hypothetical protein